MINSPNIVLTLADICSQLGYDFWQLNQPDERSLTFINSLYCNEPYPIFEHNWVHILTYLKFQSQLYAVISTYGKFILAVRDTGEILIFTPCPTDANPKLFFYEIIQLIKKFAINQLTILNVSSYWKEQYQQLLSLEFAHSEFVTRSKEEAIYDLDLLTNLSGSKFASLRNIRNKLLTSNQLTFHPLTKENLYQAKSILHTWQQVQGIKYTKDKYAKELFILQELINFDLPSDLVFMEIGRVEDKELCILIYFPVPTHPSYAINFTLKGINRTSDNGVHGVSDGAYLHTFQKLYHNGIKYLNDGELGYEEGTKTHKLNFQPVRFLQSFDVIIQP